MMTALLAAQGDEPGPYDAPRQSASFDNSKPIVAVVELSGPLVELQSFSFTGGIEGLELRKLAAHLEELAADDSNSAILLRFSDLAVGPAMAEEARGVLAGLIAKYPEKPIHCHAEAVSTFTYVVMTACTSIGITPGGQVSIPGVAAVPMHLKGMLDKVGVRADFLNIGDYKGAAEPLTREAPSKQSRETTAMILDQAFEGLVTSIHKGRNLSRDNVTTLIDQALHGADDALAENLVDKIETFANFRDGVGTNWRMAPLEGDSNPTQKLIEMLGLRPIPRPTGQRIALVYAVGNVVDGAGGAGGASREIASRKLVDALDRIGADEDVKAVVLRVSSPGGSALASEVIWAAIERLNRTRPVVVSMGAVAASGGYYISAPATRIFALENTLTGSIGVVGGKLAIGGGLSKLGITSFPTGRGKNALLFASPDPWTGSERETVRKSMKDVYDQFALRVRGGRGDVADDLMQGRVWTGKKALEHKLVDEIGGLAEALAFARAQGEVDAAAPLEIYPPAPTLDELISGFGVSYGHSQILGSVIRSLHTSDSALSRGVLSALTQTLSLLELFESTAVATVFINPTLVR